MRGLISEEVFRVDIGEDLIAIELEEDTSRLDLSANVIVNDEFKVKESSVVTIDVSLSAKEYNIAKS